MNDSNFASNETASLYDQLGMARLPFYLVVIPGIVILNLIQIVIFVCMRTQTYSNSLFVSIGLADLMSGLCLIPFWAVARIYMKWPFGQTFCHIYLAFNHVTYTVSCALLCMLAYHRYKQLEQPFKQSEKVTKRRLVYMAIPWIGYFAFYGIMSIFQGNSGQFDYETCRYYYSATFVFLETVFFLIIPTMFTIIFSAMTLVKLSQKKFKFKNNVTTAPLAKPTGAVVPQTDNLESSNTTDNGDVARNTRGSSSISTQMKSSPSNVETVKRFNRHRKAVICVIMIIFNSIVTQSFLLVMYPYAFVCKCNYTLLFFAGDVVCLFPLLNPVVVFIFHDSFKSDLIKFFKNLKAHIFCSKS